MLQSAFRWLYTVTFLKSSWDKGGVVLFPVASSSACCVSSSVRWSSASLLALSETATKQIRLSVRAGGGTGVPVAQQAERVMF